MKQLIGCYSLEHPKVRFLSLAPGLVKTKMQESIVKYDVEKIPSVKKFQEAYNTMQTSDECAKKIYNNLNSILLNKENTFYDMRNIQDAVRHNV